MESADQETKLKTFEEMLPTIEGVIDKQKKKYTLDGILWQGWDDVRQIILAHIYKKWHLWKQERPLGAWVYTVTVNQIRNIVRNKYTNYVSPCMYCPNYSGGDVCSITNGLVSKSDCDIYSEWVRTRQSAYSLAFTLPMETHMHEVESKDQQADVDVIYEKMINYLRGIFTDVDMFIFERGIIKGKTDKEISEESKEIYPRKIPISIIVTQKERVGEVAAKFLRDHLNGDTEETWA